MARRLLPTMRTTKLKLRTSNAQPCVNSDPWTVFNPASRRLRVADLTPPLVEDVGDSLGQTESKPLCLAGLTRKL